MAQITVDTERDSSATLQHLVNFLQEELRSRGSHPIPPSHNEPLRVSAPVATPSFDAPASNPFGGMFGNDNVSSGLESSPPPVSAPAPDMFSVFSHDAPAQSTSSDIPSYETATSINDNMSVSGYDSPSASSLLSEDDVEDKADHLLHHTADLAEEILRSGSTRKPDSPYKIEPYE